MVGWLLLLPAITAAVRLNQLEGKVRHRALANGAALGLVPITQQDVLSHAGIVKGEEESRSLHAEVLGNREGAG